MEFRFDHKRHLRSRRQKILVSVVLFAIGWVCWSGYTIWSFGAQDSSKVSDCAIVLGAAAYGTKPSPVLEERIKHAIELHRRGIVSTIIFTGGHGEGAAHAESKVASEYAVRAGVPEQAILIEIRSHTTRENLIEAKALMDANALGSAVIVSDPLHLKRAATMAKDLGISAVTSPTTSTRYRTVKTQMGFLLREIYFVHHYALTGN